MFLSHHRRIIAENSHFIEICRYLRSRLVTGRAGQNVGFPSRVEPMSFIVHATINRRQHYWEGSKLLLTIHTTGVFKFINKPVFIIYLRPRYLLMYELCNFLTTFSSSLLCFLLKHLISDVLLLSLIFVKHFSPAQALPCVGALLKYWRGYLREGDLLPPQGGGNDKLKWNIDSVMAAADMKWLNDKLISWSAERTSYNMQCGYS